MKYYAEVGTINGYFRYTVTANTLREAAIKTLKLHKSKGRPVRENDVVKVFDYNTNRAKTFFPR